MNNWVKRNGGKGQQDRYKLKYNNRHAPKVHVNKQKSLSKIQALFNNHKNDLGESYVLSDIIEIGYPFVETSIEVIASGKPSDILQDLHVLLIELIGAGVRTKESLASFLGVAQNDFILDELYPLLENGIVATNEDDVSFRVTTKGDLFVSEHKFIPVSTEEEFKFYVDRLTQQLCTELPSETTNTQNRIAGTTTVDYEFVQNQWFKINECFSKLHKGDKEIVDLTNYKRSILYRRDVFVKMYVLIYLPNVSGRRVQLMVYDNQSKFLKDYSHSLSDFYLTNRKMFDFGEDIQEINQYEKTFSEEADKIKSEKLASTGRYLDLSTFEHKELIKEALYSAEFAVYIESPWIRKATKDYLPGMEFLLKKKRTKLFIAYGIDSSPKNAPHPDVFREINRLKSQYPDRVFLFDLPVHFKVHFSNRDGSHRKILIKDFDFYVKGSYNWLSYNGNESQNYAVEEGTQFFDNVQGFWRKVFREYNLDASLLDFIDLPTEI